MKLKYFSGFSGIGGFDQGITQVFPDAECVGYSEVDKYAIKIYEKHFPDRINYGDIRRIDAGTLPDFDMFCGGFPCQDLSIAGKRAGLCGARSGLFFEIIRIIREKQPQFVFLENVKGLFSSNEGWDFARILIELDESGYDVEWQCLNSKNFGVPQNRERVFIIGHLRRISWKPIFPLREDDKRVDTPQGTPRTDRTRIWDEDNSTSGALRVGGSGVLENLIGCLNSKEGQHYSDNFIASTLSARDFKDGETNLVQIAPCLNAYEGGRGAKHGLISNDVKVNQYSTIRRLTPLECERLQGYPDEWTEGISDTQRYKCLGNAVTVNVIDAIVRRMHENELRK